MTRERPPTQLAQKGELIAIREIRSIPDAIRELDLIHGKHVTDSEATEFFHRISNAIADLPATHSTSTSINLFIDKGEGEVEYVVSLQPINKKFALSVTKAHH